MLKILQLAWWHRGDWNPGSVAPELRTQIEGVPSPFCSVLNIMLENIYITLHYIRKHVLLTRLGLDKKSVAHLILMFMNLISTCDLFDLHKENLEIMAEFYSVVSFK